MHSVSTCFDCRERLQKRYKLLLHCAPGYKPTQNNQETHSLRGLQAAREGAGRGRTGCQHHPYPVFDHSHRQQHPARQQAIVSAQRPPPPSLLQTWIQRQT